MRKFLKRLRVLLRLRLHDDALTTQFLYIEQTTKRVEAIEEFFASREPCKGCGHHRYRQKTLHNGCNK